MKTTIKTVVIAATVLAAGIATAAQTGSYLGKAKSLKASQSVTLVNEYDKEERLIARIGDGKFRINGKALLADVSKDLNTEFDQEHYDTISGYLTEKLGHIPTPDDRQTVLPDPATGYRFRIISTAGTMIGWLEAVAAPDLQENTEDNS